MPQPSAPEKPYECCPEPKCDSGCRNNYFEGKRLSVDSFQVEQRYHIDRRQLLNRAIHGWGIVYGFPISAECGGKPSGRQPLKIGQGLALDECGRELLHVGGSLALEDLIIVNELGRIVELSNQLASARYHQDKSGSVRKDCWLVSVHYAERYTEPVTVGDACDWDQQRWNHACETVRFSLRRVPCEECHGDDACDSVCEEPPCGTSDEECDSLQGHRDVCEQLTQFTPDDDCCGLTPIEEPCGPTLVDLRNGVPLACIELVQDECDGWTFGEEIEICGPRRFVKRNDLLFDLIPRRDLATHICEIGWKQWHRGQQAMPFAVFAAALTSDFPEEGFWVVFSRPVRRDSLRADCFAMRVMSVEREGGWWRTYRVPIRASEALDIPGAPPHPEHVLGAKLVVEEEWLEDSIRGKWSLFRGYESLVELEVRGDFIIDCNGRAVDANARGISPSPSGNGIPGGTFLSTFKVTPQENYKQAQQPQSAE